MSLDLETLLGFKSEVLKAAVSASLLGVLWSRQFQVRRGSLIARCGPRQRDLCGTVGDGA